jgi:hypothetical protein
METITYLSVAYRTQFMNENLDRILKVLAKIPVVTMSGVANGAKSVFKPGVDVIENGCLVDVLGHCLSGTFYNGPYDKSDGLVPLKASQLPGIDSVILPGADHGEPIVNLPFQEYSKEVLTEAMMKILLDRSRR